VLKTLHSIILSYKTIPLF